MLPRSGTEAGATIRPVDAAGAEVIRRITERRVRFVRQKAARP